MGCGAETKDLKLEVQKDFIRGCKGFHYLGVKIAKKDHCWDVLPSVFHKGPDFDSRFRLKYFFCNNNVKII